MASQTLALLMAAHGARQTARDVDKVGRSVRDVGDGMRKTTNRVGMFERALNLLGTRLGMIIILGAALTLTLGPPLLVALTLLTAAIVTVGMVALPIFALVAGAVALFGREADEAGTAANALKSKLKSFSDTFKQVIRPGAEIMFENLARVLSILQPVLRDMKEPLKVFAGYLGLAMQDAARGVAALGPEFKSMLMSAAPLLSGLGGLVGPFLGMLIDVARAGIPVLAQLVEWLTDFIVWLRPAIQDLIAFEQSAKALDIAESWMAAVASAAEWLWSVLESLWTIGKELWDTLAPTVIPALLIALEGVRVALEFIANNIDWLLPLAAALFLMFVVATGALLAPFELATWAIVAIVAAVIALESKFGILRWTIQAVIDVVEWWWGVVRDSPMGQLAADAWSAVGGFQGLADAISLYFGPTIEAWKPTIQWLVDKLKWIVDNAGKVKEAYDWVKEKSGGEDPAMAAAEKLPYVGPIIKAFGGMAEGGHVVRGGRSVVGERGPEVVDLPGGSTVWPNGSGGDIWVAATLVMPDGQVLAQQTLKASRKRQASR